MKWGCGLGSMGMCGVGEGKGRSGEGVGSGCGGSSSIRDWLIVVFASVRCWGDAEFQQFFSADYGELGFFSDDVFS